MHLGEIFADYRRLTESEPFFFLEENYGTTEEKCHQLDIPDETIDTMRTQGRFQLPSLTIKLLSTSNKARISLRLQPDCYNYRAMEGSVEPELSISGFPRELWSKDANLTPGVKEDFEGSNEKSDLVERESIRTVSEASSRPSNEEKHSRRSWLSRSKMARSANSSPSVFQNSSSSRVDVNLPQRSKTTFDIKSLPSTSHSNRSDWEEKSSIEGDEEYGEGGAVFEAQEESEQDE